MGNCRQKGLAKNTQCLEASLPKMEYKISFYPKEAGSNFSCSAAGKLNDMKGGGIRKVKVCVVSVILK